MNITLSASIQSQFIQPRALVHRGTIEARALFFDSALLGEEEARYRIVQNWSQGAQVYEVAGGYLLRWAAPRLVACATAPAAVLTEERGLLLAAPLSEDEQRALEISSESLVLLRGGAAQVFSLAECKSIDISTWLDVSNFQTLPMLSLGEAPSAPPLLMRENAFDVREKLGVEAAPELEKLLAQMREDKTKKEREGPVWPQIMALLAKLWQALAAPRRRNSASYAAPDESAVGAVGRGKLTFLSVVWALLQIGFIAALALFMMSLSSSKINFSAIFWALAIGVVFYALMALLWKFLFWVFVEKNALGENSSRWKWLLGGALFVFLLLLFPSVGSFDWRAFASVIFTAFFMLLWVLFIGALLIGAVVWLVRQFETTAKKPKAAAPLVNAVPTSWIGGGAALGVLFGALGCGDLISALLAFLVLLSALIYEFFRWKKKPKNKAAPTSGVAPASAQAPKPLTSLMPPLPVEGPFAALRNALARAAWMAGLWRIYGPIQARYIARLMDMFARGDLDNALRHAIPMGGAGMGKAAPAFGLPMPRGLLEIFTGHRIGASVLPMPPDIAEQLRQQYRAAFERLDAQGRHEEAAFVLAELLHASAEAVAYLERQNRLRLAAELAESRDLPPDLIVRQWLVAGETERALWIARRKNAFSSAIARLEKGGDDDQKTAQKLRLLWANELARSGDFVAAVGVAWPIVEARNLALEWIKRGLLLGGVAKARMLTWRCQISTSLEPPLRELVLDFLSEADASEARLIFAKGLNEGAPTPLTKTLSRAITRALVRDAANDDFNEVRKAACQKLIEIAGDGALRADVPPRLFVSRGKTLKERETPLEIIIEADDTGALPLYDAAYLPDGRTVVALGEAGARLLSRDGKTIAHFDQPCYRLVLSNNGDRALALAPRGEVTRIAKLDFASRRAVSWCETRLDACAYSYDGALWFVAAENSLMAIDTTAQKFGALWHTPEVGEVACIERSPTSCAFLTRFMARENFGFRLREKWERWQLEVPSLILRQRMVIPDWGAAMTDDETNIAASAFTVGVMPDGVWARLVGGGENLQDPPIVLEPHKVTLLFSQHKDLPFRMPYGLQGSAGWLLALVNTTNGQRCFLLERASNQVRAVIVMNGTLTPQARFAENYLTLCDERGRLVVIDLQSGGIVKNFRLA